MIHGIHRLALILVTAFFVISFGLGYWQFVGADDLVGDPTLNRARLLDEELHNQRGMILDRNGQVLARTDMTPDGGRRVYTAPWLVHVTGHYSLQFGSTNVEQTFDKYLRGKAGVDAVSSLESRLLHKPLVGDDVVLTIDRRIQQAAEEALGDARGAIIAMDPRNGEILALASHPYYDPNKLETDWESIRTNQATPLINRATQGLYVPGSTFKTATIAAALDSGVFTPAVRLDYTLRPGPPAYHTQVFNGYSVYCGNHQQMPAGPLELSLQDAYASSCNVAFAEMGVRMGQQKLTDYMARFGFGSSLPIDITSATSRLSATPDLLKDDAALASTAFGQGELLVTPLQMALVTNAVANDGSIMTPHVVKEVRRQQDVVWQTPIESWRQPIQPATANAVTSMMVASVENGWATGAKIAGVKVAGKTGTAETGDNDSTHAWFTAFAPADNPTISVVVVKEHAGTGSAEAIPAAKRVMEAALALPRQ